jgi:hypothetical protein
VILLAYSRPSLKLIDFSAVGVLFPAVLAFRVFVPSAARHSRAGVGGNGSRRASRDDGNPFPAYLAIERRPFLHRVIHTLLSLQSQSVWYLLAYVVK